MKYLRDLEDYFEDERGSAYLPSTIYYLDENYDERIDYCGYRQNGLALHIDGIRKTQSEYGGSFQKNNIVITSEYNVTDVSRPLNPTIFSTQMMGGGGLIPSPMYSFFGLATEVQSIDNYISESNNNTSLINFGSDHIMLGNSSNMCVINAKRPVIVGRSNLPPSSSRDYTIEMCFSITSLCGAEQYMCSYEMPFINDASDFFREYGFMQTMFLCGYDSAYNGTHVQNMYPTATLLYNTSINNSNKNDQHHSSMVNNWPIVLDYLNNDYDNVIFVAFVDGIGEYYRGFRNLWVFDQFILPRTNDMDGTTTVIGHPFINQYHNIFNNTVYTLSMSNDFCILYDHSNDNFMQWTVDSDEIFKASTFSRNDIIQMYAQEVINGFYKNLIYIGNVLSSNTDINSSFMFNDRINATTLCRLFDTQFSTKIYSLRLYDKQITRFDSLNNAKIDHLRFKLGS